MPPHGELAGDDVALYRRFVEGDNRAFTLLYQRHNGKLLAYTTRMTRDAMLAQDLSHEAWGRMVKLRNAKRDLENPIGFLMRMARNLCLDSLKSRSRSVQLSTVDASEQPVCFIPEPSEYEELVVRSLEMLSFDYREVLVLNIYCGYSLEEIGVMLGKSSQAIWTRASRARKALRKLVEAANSDISANHVSPGRYTQ